MNSRIKVVYQHAISSFGSDWLAPLVNQYFDFERWDPTVTYSPGTLFYLNCLDFPDYNNILTHTPEQLANLGFRVIIDNLWEIYQGPVKYAHVIHSIAWFWYNESLWYYHRGYHHYQPQRDPQYLGLMPMRLVRCHRDEFLEKIDHLLPRMMWSYVDKGRNLPNDTEFMKIPGSWHGQRHMNPQWYDQTYLSMVLETRVDPARYHPTFITEKTFKPIAYRHPFIVYGNRNILRTLQSLGFQTWSNLWDESYDTIQNVEQRRDAVIDLLETVQVCEHDAETLRRLEHNHHHFFNQQLVRHNIVKEIFEPIIEYANSTSV